MTNLEDRLNYHFQNPSLLEAALTHPSYGSDHHTDHYQRLEFLGDAVLQLAVSKYLFERYPGVDEGRLTRARASLVCEESLSQSAAHFEMGQWIRLSVGEERAGGREKPSILSDVMEAVIAAVFLDGGVEAAFQLALSALSEQLKTDVTKDTLDDKSRLQMLLQKNGGAAPVYELVGRTGAPHQPVFTIKVMADGKVLGEGSGHSKQAAQQQAAHNAMENVNQLDQAKGCAACATEET